MADGGIISGSAISSIFTATLRISQAVYELKAVGEQTRDLLATTSHIDKSMRHVRTLRRQKSTLLQSTEKRWIDDVLKDTEKAMGDVATLIEPARVDMQTRFGGIGMKTRAKFVLMDSPKVGVNLARLGIANNSLNSVMGVLCNRDGHISPPVDGGIIHKVDSASPLSDTGKAPPSYGESEFLMRNKRSNIALRSEQREPEARPALMEDQERLSMSPKVESPPVPSHWRGTWADPREAVKHSMSSTTIGEDFAQIRISSPPSQISTAQKVDWPADAPVVMIAEMEGSAYRGGRDYFEGAAGFQVVEDWECAVRPPRQSSVASHSSVTNPSSVCSSPQSVYLSPTSLDGTNASYRGSPHLSPTGPNPPYPATHSDYTSLGPRSSAPVAQSATYPPYPDHRQQQQHPQHIAQPSRHPTALYPPCSAQQPQDTSPPYLLNTTTSPAPISQPMFPPRAPHPENTVPTPPPVSQHSQQASQAPQHPRPPQQRPPSGASSFSSPYQSPNPQMVSPYQHRPPSTTSFSESSYPNPSPQTEPDQVARPPLLQQHSPPLQQRPHFPPSFVPSPCQSPDTPPLPPQQSPPLQQRPPSTASFAPSPYQSPTLAPSIASRMSYSSTSVLHERPLPPPPASTSPYDPTPNPANANRTPSIYSVSTLNGDIGGGGVLRQTGKARSKAWLEYQAGR